KARWPHTEFHIINAGNWGYQSSQELLYYSFYAKPWNPDLVIFLDGDNDSYCAGISRTWKPHYQDMTFTNEKYREIFKPTTAFADYIQSLLSLPQPLYSLSIVARLISKAKDIAVKHAPQKMEGPFVFHQEAGEQLKANILSGAI